jgi:hypothetical protein
VLAKQWCISPSRAARTAGCLLRDSKAFPLRSGQFEYRIKHQFEEHDRVAAEEDLSVLGTEGLQKAPLPPAARQIKRAQLSLRPKSVRPSNGGLGGWWVGRTTILMLVHLNAPSWHRFRCKSIGASPHEPGPQKEPAASYWLTARQDVDDANRDGAKHQR